MNILKKLREDSQFSMLDVCRSLGIQTASYSRYEKTGFPAEKRIVNLARLYQKRA